MEKNNMSHTYARYDTPIKSVSIGYGWSDKKVTAKLTIKIDEKIETVNCIPTSYKEARTWAKNCKRLLLGIEYR